METNKSTAITVRALVQGDIEKVWRCWTEPHHITQWNAASDDWHTPRATNDLRIGGKFTSRMEAKDGSMGFDFEGVYDALEKHKLISYTMADGRKVSIHFVPRGEAVEVTETFDAEQMNPVDMQRDGWQAILNNFKQYTEKH